MVTMGAEVQLQRGMQKEIRGMSDLILKKAHTNEICIAPVLKGFFCFIIFDVLGMHGILDICLALFFFLSFWIFNLSALG